MANDDIPQDGEAQEPSEEQHRDLVEIEMRTREMLDDEAFRRAVNEIVHRILTEKEAVRLELCVDEEIEVELGRKWGRNDPPNPFGLFTSLMKERPGAWVSPGMSVRMFDCVERVARLAYNEATR